MNKTYIIAEAGVNHNGSLDLAFELIDVAVKAGADAVKFQTFKAENLVTKKAQQAAYQIENIGEETSQFEMLKKLELNYNEFLRLKAYCDEKKIEFLSTPFEFESVDFLVETLGMNTVKIPSGELTNSPFIHYIATKRKPIILSTGMANMEDIFEALSFIAYGLAFPNKKVELESVRSFYATDEAKKCLKRYVTILHCTTEYPTPYKDVNLQAMDHLKRELQVEIGLSDHSKGIYVPIAAVGKGAKVIEKHFTINRMLPGPDHQASLEPAELIEMVNGIRIVEATLGNCEKKPTANEEKNRIAARKSLVASREIQVGDIFTSDNLTIKRPGNGLAPSKWWELLGTTASKSYEEDELIDE
ncbi:N-acetylneuraminate synthase [Lederbergia wuyishanensis]|uniref:N-acetylneuraminate synthase n=1 Tax=Lederbergia wuyishanensis TaxID=1347903 RepID=A0ABU0D8S7_9BACI|nr:N-acetylneuraminate synthase [Lederbergia wuyishanensis]MCJ8007606.1 N-acetylneuraminate synthase [Lederbergia wuyishanensis]MDQ0344810.1 N-acetylneuraminate synthase [Lederbergia wuyishanensis]